MEVSGELRLFLTVMLLQFLLLITADAAGSVKAGYCEGTFVVLSTFFACHGLNDNELLTFNSC